MAEEQALICKLAGRLKPKRLQHSINVCEAAGKMAGQYGIDAQQARLAGLLHDCARAISDEELLPVARSFGIVIGQVDEAMPLLLHAPVGAEIAQREFGISDGAILRAIAIHTTGDRNMTVLDKIIYLADCIEPGRCYPGVDELRQLAVQELDSAMVAALDHSIAYIMSRHGLIHPATIAARNDLLINGTCRQEESND